MSDPLSHQLRDVAHALKTERPIPEGMDVGAICWEAADSIDSLGAATQNIHDPLEGALERAEGRSARLAESVGLLLPLARRLAKVLPEHGGPVAQELVEDEIDATSMTFPVVLDAQILLETGIPSPAEPFDISHYEAEDFQDTDPTPLIETTDIGDTLETALMHAHALLTRRNMLRIVRSPPVADLEESYDTTLRTLYRRLQDHLADHLPVDTHTPDGTPC